MLNSGVYAIQNLKTGKFYIGSSKNLTKRLRRHKNNLLKDKHENPILSRAVNKYGINSLSFKILMYTDSYLELEQKLLDKLNPAYNIALSATAPMLGRTHSPETIKKFKGRKAASGVDHYMYGKSHSAEVKRKMSKSRKGSKRSKETKAKMSQTAIRLNSIGRVDRSKQRKKIICSNGICYKSMIDAAIFNGVSVQTICDILKKRHSQTRSGLSFEYL